jgi:hypothetical protein
MTAEAAAPDNKRPGDGSPADRAADDRPDHAVMYERTMARFGAMYDDWLKAVDAIVGGRAPSPPPPTGGE